MNVPGLVVVAPATPYDAKGLLIASIEDDNPILFLEHKALYRIKGEVPEEKYTVPLRKAAWSVKAPTSRLSPPCG